MTALDPRQHAFRADLADERLAGRLGAVDPAPVFVAGRAARVIAPVVPFHREPDRGAMVVAVRLRGETLFVFEEREDGFVWAQSRRDGYVGYAPAEAVALGPSPIDAAPGAEVRVRVPRAHLYPAPEVKAPAADWAPLEARLSAATPRESVDGFLRLADGLWIYAAHTRVVDAPAVDWVAAAERFLDTPYLWGGESVEGIDCSGLIKVAMWAANLDCPRDSDQQFAAFSRAVPIDGALARGDLIFWKGHVGVMVDAERLLHANAHHMSTVIEPLAEARARIAADGGGEATGARRPQT